MSNKRGCTNLVPRVANYSKNQQICEFSFSQRIGGTSCTEVSWDLVKIKFLKIIVLRIIKFYCLDYFESIGSDCCITFILKCLVRILLENIFFVLFRNVSSP